MTEERVNPLLGLSPEELDRKVNKAFAEGLAALATEVETFRIIKAEVGEHEARIATATQLSHGRVGELASLLLIAIDHLASEQDLAGVALARTVPAVAPDYGSGGYV